MKHFGALLRRLRGKTTLREIQRRTGLSHSYLSKIERGASVPGEARVRQILGQGFGLEEREIERALIEVGLEDCGLEEADLIRFIADLIQGSLTRAVRRRFVSFCRSYARAAKPHRSGLPR